MTNCCPDYYIFCHCQLDNICQRRVHEKEMKSRVYIFIVSDPPSRFGKRTRISFCFFASLETNIVQKQNDISLVSVNMDLEITVSGNTVSGNTVSGNTVLGNTVLGNMVSENTVLVITVSVNTVSGKPVSGNTVSGKAAWLNNKKLQFRFFLEWSDPAGNSIKIFVVQVFLT